MSKLNTEEILNFIKERFNLMEDKADDIEIVASIEKGIVFKGTNLWILIFAILLASVGLNVNSTAVIIGAMLVSPLMGPIMGLGLGVGITDFELIKKSLKNFGLAVGISIVTSTLYFAVSPLGEAQSELLARTYPTTWDVLIAFFGGMAGIVAMTRKEKGYTVIPGVAIATALMPPLCTAGYGVATGNLYFFAGAAYLFFINSVFISLATFIMVRFLNFPKIHFADSKREKQMKNYVWITVTLTIIPSIYLGYKIVNKSIFESNAIKFIKTEFDISGVQIIGRNIDANTKTIELILLGEFVDDKMISTIKNKLNNYGLEKTNLNIKQGFNQNMNLEEVKTGVIEELYKKNEEALISKEKQISFLEQELTKFKINNLPVEDISYELKAQYPDVESLVLSQSLRYNLKTDEQDTVVTAIVTFVANPKINNFNKIENWLKARTKKDKVILIVN